VLSGTFAYRCFHLFSASAFTTFTTFHLFSEGSKSRDRALTDGPSAVSVQWKCPVAAVRPI